MAKRLRVALAAINWPDARPLVLLASGNFGKTLGHYISDWGRLSTPLVVIDEMPERNAHFASLGAVCQNMVPVTFHGLG